MRIDRRPTPGGIPVLAGVLTLVTPVSLLAAEGAAGVFDINPGLSIWLTVVFGGLLLILWKWAWAPMLGLLEARESSIQSAIDEAASMRDEAAAMLAEHKEQLADARRQAQEIIAEGKAAGERLRKEIEVKARDEGQAMLERARKEIGREKDVALDELRKESVDLALAAAGKLVHEHMDADRDRELVMQYLEDLSVGRTVGGAEA